MYMVYFYTASSSVYPFAVSLQGDYFQSVSVFGSLLSTSTMVTTLNPRMLVSERYSCFVGMRNFPNPQISEVEQCHVSKLNYTGHEGIQVMGTYRLYGLWGVYWS